MKFNELDICPEILLALDKLGYTAPSPIQEQSIPSVMLGKDLLGCAKTGSGKTAAFAVPILQNLYKKYKGDNTHNTIRALILTPTRELALQIQDSFHAYGEYLPLKCGCLLGGVSQKPQEEMLKDGVDILVATPGRLYDLMNQKIADVSKVEILVLDEADRMLDMGFLNDVKRITSRIPKTKQTLLFSATMSGEIRELINSELGDYITVEADPAGKAADSVSQEVYFVDRQNKRKLVQWLLQERSMYSVIVFTRTKHGADNLARALSKGGISVRAIHGDKSQTNRQNSLAAFKSGDIQALIATDIAARGIDIHDLDYVINFDIPEDSEMYVHRIGRTGRAGEKGCAISLCSYREKPLLEDIEKLIGEKIPVSEDNPYPMEDFTLPPSNQSNRSSHKNSGKRNRPAEGYQNQKSSAPKTAAPNTSQTVSGSVSFDSDKTKKRRRKRRRTKRMINN